MNKPQLFDFDMNRPDYFALLHRKTTGRAVRENIPQIYEFLSNLFGVYVDDPAFREWAFEWCADDLGIDIGIIEEEWFNSF
jgi:hypothetical protein